MGVPWPSLSLLPLHTDGLDGFSAGRNGAAGSGGAVAADSRFVGALSVGFPVEVEEEDEENDAVHADEPDEGFGEIAVDEEQLESVVRESHELDHLQRRQVFLPPGELLVLRSHCRNAVVQVHPNVHETVEHSEESGVAARNETHAEPDAERDHTVVHHVQHRDLVVLFAHHEEDLPMKTS